MRLKGFVLAGVMALTAMAGSMSNAMAGKLEDIKDRGVIRVGVSLGGEPIGFRDGENNPAG